MMINVKLEDFITENVKRTASNGEMLKVIKVLKEITMLTPKEVGHLLYIFASAERARKMKSEPLKHFKELLSNLKKVCFALECEAYL